MVVYIDPMNNTKQRTRMVGEINPALCQLANKVGRLGLNYHRRETVIYIHPSLTSIEVTYTEEVKFDGSEILNSRMTLMRNTVSFMEAVILAVRRERHTNSFADPFAIELGHLADLIQKWHDFHIGVRSYK